MLNEIKTKLEQLSRPVYYGQAGTLDGGDLWDYIVFFRDTLSYTTNKTGFADSYMVVIVQEEFIDDETIFGVIDAMESIPGMRLAQGDMAYQYTTKPNTSTVIEMLMLEFVKPKKRCANGGD